eukprot:sb/3469103/
MAVIDPDSTGEEEDEDSRTDTPMSDTTEVQLSDHCFSDLGFSDLEDNMFSSLTGDFEGLYRPNQVEQEGMYRPKQVEQEVLLSRSETPKECSQEQLSDQVRKLVAACDNHYNSFSPPPPPCDLGIRTLPRKLNMSEYLSDSTQNLRKQPHYNGSANSLRKQSHYSNGSTTSLRTQPHHHHPRALPQVGPHPDYTRSLDRRLPQNRRLEELRRALEMERMLLNATSYWLVLISFSACPHL